MKSWVKLNLFYLGKSKKHQIFRAKKWNKGLEKILNKPVFTENYEQIGYIKEVFGPINSPFISIQAAREIKFRVEEKLYVKLRK